VLSDRSNGPRISSGSGAPPWNPARYLCIEIRDPDRLGSIAHTHRARVLERLGGSSTAPSAGRVHLPRHPACGLQRRLDVCAQRLGRADLALCLHKRGLLRGAFRAPYARGVPTTEFKQTSRTQSGERHGTKTTFHPDPESFKNVLEFRFE
jgi:hypothetical protein